MLWKVASNWSFVSVPNLRSSKRINSRFNCFSVLWKVASYRYFASVPNLRSSKKITPDLIVFWCSGKKTSYQCFVSIPDLRSSKRINSRFNCFFGALESSKRSVPCNFRTPPHSPTPTPLIRTACTPPHPTHAPAPARPCTPLHSTQPPTPAIANPRPCTLRQFPSTRPQPAENN